jgi:hypothetical protein
VAGVLRPLFLLGNLVGRELAEMTVEITIIPNGSPIMDGAPPDAGGRDPRHAA